MYIQTFMKILIFEKIIKPEIVQQIQVDVTKSTYKEF